MKFLSQVIGPKNDIIADVIRQLVEKFKSEVIDINKLNSSSFEFSGSESTGKKSVLLYSHTPVTSEVAIAELTAVIEKTFERVDVLVVAQDKNPVQRDTPHSFLNQLNKELLQQFWVSSQIKVLTNTTSVKLPSQKIITSIYYSRR